MSDALKANIQSFVRAGLNAFAGAWIIKHPEMGGVIEGAIIALVALVWTYVDNKKKNEEPPAPRITTTLGCIFIIFMASGCASNFGYGTKVWKYQDAQSVLKSVKEYEKGELVKEEIYAVFEPTNAPSKWRSSNRALALADSKNDVNKAKSTTTDKTVSTGFDNAAQETKGDIVPNTVKELGTAVPAILSPLKTP